MAEPGFKPDLSDSKVHVFVYPATLLCYQYYKTTHFNYQQVVTSANIKAVPKPKTVWWREKERLILRKAVTLVLTNFSIIKDILLRQQKCVLPPGAILRKKKKTGERTLTHTCNFITKGISA